MREDELHENRFARVTVAIMLAASSGFVVYLAVIGESFGGLVPPALSFFSFVVLFIRIRQPMHTWPGRLFTVKR